MTSAADAAAAGYKPVTRPYSEKERWMLDRAVEQFRGVDIVLVSSAWGPEIWRRAAELRNIDDDDGVSAAQTKHPRHHGRNR